MHASDVNLNCRFESESHIAKGTLNAFLQLAMRVHVRPQISRIMKRFFTKITLNGRGALIFVMCRLVEFETLRMGRLKIALPTF